MSKINYDKWIRCEVCSLEEAVGVITEILNLNDAKSTRTYKKALEDIKKKKLRARFEFEEPNFELHDGGVDGVTRNFLLDEYQKAVQENNFEQASSFQIEPRDFIKWCNENQIHVTPELNKFFNYDYWLIYRKYWSFHEAVMVILSKDSPPFPHEIENVFEKDDEHHYFATKLKQSIDDWSNQICCYELDNGNPVEIQFSSKFYSINEVYFERENLLLEIKKEVNSLEGVTKNNKFKISSKSVEDHASKLVKKEEEKDSDLKAAIKKIDSEDGEKIYNKSLKDWPTEKRILTLEECLNLLFSINQYFFGYLVGESSIVNEIEHYLNSKRFAWLSERYHNKFLYQELLFKSFEAGEIKFVRDSKIDKEARKLSGQVNVKDFLQWAENHQIKPFAQKAKSLGGVVGDEIVAEIEYKKLDETDAELIVRYYGKEIILGRFKHGQTNGKVLTILIDKAVANGGYISLDSPNKDLGVSGKFDPSKFPNALGFGKKPEGKSYSFRSVFFENCGKKGIKFYSKITKERLSKIG